MSQATTNMRKATFVSWFCVISLLFAHGTADAEQDECDKEKCPGPLKAYEELRCKPVNDENDESACCATSYDCSHLTSRSRTKCYANDHAYELGEELRDEDRNSPCDKCTCIKAQHQDAAMFKCAPVDCPQGSPKDGCFFRNDLDSCCEREEVCQKEEDRAKCQVDGKTYLDGQYFTPESNPDVYCQCREGFKENSKEFCRRGQLCGMEIRDIDVITRHCAPVYYFSQSPATACSLFSRCQNDLDKVVPAETSDEPSKDVPDEMKCKFGNLTMRRGDELNQATDYSSVCVKCVCEVPPIPTCQRLPDEECDVTKMRENVN